MAGNFNQPKQSDIIPETEKTEQNTPIDQTTAPVETDQKQSDTPKIEGTEKVKTAEKITSNVQEQIKNLNTDVQQAFSGFWGFGIPDFWNANEALTQISEDFQTKKAKGGCFYVNPLVPENDREEYENYLLDQLKVKIKPKDEVLGDVTEEELKNILNSFNGPKYEKYVDDNVKDNPSLKENYENAKKSDDNLIKYDDRIKTLETGMKEITDPALNTQLIAIKEQFAQIKERPATGDFKTLEANIAKLEGEVNKTKSKSEAQTYVQNKIKDLPEALKTKIPPEDKTAADNAAINFGLVLEIENSIKEAGKEKEATDAQTELTKLLGTNPKESEKLLKSDITETLKTLKENLTTAQTEKAEAFKKGDDFIKEWEKAAEKYPQYATIINMGIKLLLMIADLPFVGNMLPWKFSPKTREDILKPEKDKTENPEQKEKKEPFQEVIKRAFVNLTTMGMSDETEGKLLFLLKKDNYNSLKGFAALPPEEINNFPEQDQKIIELIKKKADEYKENPEYKDMPVLAFIDKFKAEEIAKIKETVTPKKTA